MCPAVSDLDFGREPEEERSRVSDGTYFVPIVTHLNRALSYALSEKGISA